MRERADVVLLTNDIANIQKSKEIGVNAISSYSTLISLILVEDYIKDLDDADVLMDMISVSTERPSLKRGENIYPEVSHLLQI